MDIREIKPVGEIEPRLPKVNDKIIGKQKKDTCAELKAEAAEIKRLHFWEQSGFKRGCGGALMLIGGILTMIPKANILGQALFGVGSGIFGVGVVSAAKKSGPEDNGNTGLYQTIIDEGKKILAEIKK